MDIFERIGHPGPTALEPEELRRGLFYGCHHARVLSECPPSDHVGPLDDLQWKYLHQEDAASGLPVTSGSRRVVVFNDRRFYIEMLYWMEASATLHQHAFSGAFHVLGGSSVQGLYRFEPQARVTSRLLFGPIDLVRVELLRLGSTHPIRSTTRTRSTSLPPGAAVSHGGGAHFRQDLSTVPSTTTDALG